MKDGPLLRQRTWLVILLGITLTVGILLGAAMENIRWQNKVPRLQKPHSVRSIQTP